MRKSRVNPANKTYPKLGLQLKKTRTEKGLSLDSVVRDTKIKKQILEKFEVGEINFDNPYQRGQIASYVNFLGLSTKKLFEHYSPQSPKKKRQQKKVKPLRRIERTKRAVVASSSAKVSLAFGFVLLAFCGVALLIYFFFSAPKLTIDNLPNQHETSESSIVINGSTGSGSDVFINATPVPVTPEGSFSQRIFLSPGINIITIEAENNLSRRAYVEKIVIADYERFD